MREFASSKLQAGPSEVYNEVLRNRVARITNQNRPDIIMVDGQHYDEMVEQLRQISLPREG